MTEEFVRNALPFNPKFTRQNKLTRAIVHGETRAFDRGHFDDPCTKLTPSANTVTVDTATVDTATANTATVNTATIDPGKNVPRCKYNTKCTKMQFNLDVFSCIFDAMSSSICYIVHGEFEKAFSKQHLFYFTMLAIILFLIGFIVD